MQIKWQFHTTTHKSEWLKLKWLTISNTGEDVEQMELKYITSGYIKWDNHFRKLFGSFLQI